MTYILPHKRHVDFVLSYQLYSLKSRLDPEKLHSPEGVGRKPKLHTELLKAKYELSKKTIQR